MWYEKYVVKTLCHVVGPCFFFSRHDLDYKVVNGVRWYTLFMFPDEGLASS